MLFFRPITIDRKKCLIEKAKENMSLDMGIFTLK